MSICSLQYAVIRRPRLFGATAFKVKGKLVRGFEGIGRAIPGRRDDRGELKCE